MLLEASAESEIHIRHNKKGLFLAERRTESAFVLENSEKRETSIRYSPASFHLLERL